jgi:NAD(P)-dependent dehydrogenase (short-subunit alcohol dehydrogenase family)
MVPRMIGRSGGAVVNVSSVQGLACQGQRRRLRRSKGALDA